MTRVIRLRLPRQLVWIVLLLLLGTARLSAQERTVRGSITFITAEYVYTTLGRSSGVADSGRIAVIVRGDTTAILKVAAISSKSSACTLVSSKRKPVVGDTVVARVIIPAVPDTTAVARTDTTRGAPAPVTTGAATRRVEPAGSSFVAVQGRVSLQYRALVFSQHDYDQFQPGMALQLRGKFANSDFSFQVNGNFRTLIRTASTIASNSSTNQTRIYRLSLDYDDGVNMFSLGRVLPPYAPSIGTVDGALYAHAFGAFSLGLSAGFEPSFIQGISATDLRKFSLFAAYRTTERPMVLASLVYSRTYYQSTLARDVASTSILLFPNDQIFFNGQADLDLKTFNNGELTGKAKLTSLYSSINFRPFQELSLGFGISAWRPTYYLLTIVSTPPAFLDTKLRTSPMVTVTVNPVRTVSFMNTYSPRSSDSGFAKEYNNSTSLNWSDALGSGMNIRGTYFVNKTITTDIAGYSGSAQKTISRFLDLTARFQSNRLTIASFNQVSRTNALAGDLLLTLFTRSSLWISLERDFGDQLTFTSVYTELSYRF